MRLAEQTSVRSNWSLGDKEVDLGEGVAVLNCDALRACMLQVLDGSKLPSGTNPGKQIIDPPCNAEATRV